ncbi:hypothetical protein CYMTET_20130 [Cymbomonas tetramitiformis]|uniref:protein-tyrosine-phosphatase n=1 Tax=Cymbomonas tetramitiformis TaxID=36881 RepID=A0AAE0G4T3_9CHLO|nr:hypothetical protein CYMTET_20130 [Cymbomonas tetramitiformis]
MALVLFSSEHLHSNNLHTFFMDGIDLDKLILANEEISRMAADCFRKYDIDKSGAIDTKELKSLLTEMKLTENMSEEELEVVVALILQKVDLNRDGSLSYNEFTKFFNSMKTLQQVKANSRKKLDLMKGKTSQQHAFQAPALVSIQEATYIEELDEEDLRDASGTLKPTKAPPFYPDCGSQAERNSISEIIPEKLYLSNFRGADNLEKLRELGITGVIRCNYSDDGTELPDITYFNIDVDDDASQSDALAAHFKSANNFIDREKDFKVLVNCSAGISRSPTIVLAYLVSRRKMSLFKAFRKVYRARPVIWPNDGFMRSLIKYEIRLHKTYTIKLEKYLQWAQYEAPGE